MASMQIEQSVPMPIALENSCGIVAVAYLEYHGLSFRVEDEIKRHTLSMEFVRNVKCDLNTFQRNFSYIVFYVAASGGSKITGTYPASKCERTVSNYRYAYIETVVRNEILKVNVSFFAADCPVKLSKFRQRGR